jgi:hypothetical protein
MRHGRDKEETGAKVVRPRSARHDDGRGTRRVSLNLSNFDLDNHLRGALG